MGKRVKLALLCSFIPLTVVLAQNNLKKVNINNFEELKEYFHYDDLKPVIISGHRGGMSPGYPENSIEAMEKTLTILPSFFEIDPRLTKDSVLVLMHDKTLDRTTNMSGEVADYTYEELKAAKLKDRQGNITDYRIPTLEQALEWGKDKTIFNMDNKSVPWSKYVEIFKDGNYSNIILSVRSMEEATYYYNRLNEVLFCIAIKNQKDLDAFTETGIPFDRLVAYVGYTMNPKNHEVYEFLRSKGVMCFIAIAPTQDRKKSDLARLKGYSEELIKKPDIIETDYPYLFINN